MSIQRQYGFIVLCCDDCGETFMLNKGDPFEKVWTEAKDSGWQVRKIGADWVHFCGKPCEPDDA